MEAALSILKEVTLMKVRKTRNGGRMQTFYFAFLYREKRYILRHTFEYHGAGVSHWFYFQKPRFMRKPFSFSKAELIFLSDTFMSIQNTQKADSLFL